MGGSSLTAEVLSSLQAKAGITAPLSLAILDSTDPEQVSLAGSDFPPDKSLYIVASKSGGTAEVMAAFDYFWKMSNGDGSRFVATTDPGTSLESLARNNHFRKIFSSDETVVVVSALRLRHGSCCIA
jgi:glucose-6-phosphate isomerase